VLVVANQTAGSDELIGALSATIVSGRPPFTPRVPAGMNGAAQRCGHAKSPRGGRAHTRRQPGSGAWLRPDDPHAAVCELYRPREHDQISASTLESPTPRSLRIDLPRRVHGTTGAVLTHASAKGRLPHLLAPSHR
jgi:hypothetical protein